MKWYSTVSTINNHLTYPHHLDPPVHPNFQQVELQRSQDARTIIRCCRRGVTGLRLQTAYVPYSYAWFPPGLECEPFGMHLTRRDRPRRCVEWLEVRDQ